VLKQLKFNDTPFTLNTLSVETDGVFLPKSTLNSLRRDAVKKLIDKIIDKNSPKNQKVNDFTLKKFINNQQDNCKYVILDEDNLSLDKINDNIVIVSPKLYNCDTAINIANKLKSINYDKAVYINLPIIATCNEVLILDNMLKKLSELYGNVGVVANNLYGLKYVNIYPVIGGTGLNVYNSYTAKALTNFGVKTLLGSIELNHNDFGLTYSGNHPLMTLCHCPYIVAKNSTCNKCKYDGKLIYVDDKNNPYKIRRYKIINCYFEVLFDGKDKTILDKNNANVYDLR
jgi:putative protease